MLGLHFLFLDYVVDYVGLRLPRIVFPRVSKLGLRFLFLYFVKTNTENIGHFYRPIKISKPSSDPSEMIKNGKIGPPKTRICREIDF